MEKCENDRNRSEKEYNRITKNDRTQTVITFKKRTIDISIKVDL